MTSARASRAVRRTNATLGELVEPEPREHLPAVRNWRAQERTIFLVHTVLAHTAVDELDQRLWIRRDEDVGVVVNVLCGNRGVHERRLEAGRKRGRILQRRLGRRLRWRGRLRVASGGP